MKDYVKKFMKANLLGFEEEFNITKTHGTYYIKENYNLIYTDDGKCYHNLLIDLLCDRKNVIPIFPQYQKKYYYIKFTEQFDAVSKISIKSDTFIGTDFDYKNRDSNNCFRSYEEAKQHFDKFCDELNKAKVEIWNRMFNN